MLSAREALRRLQEGNKRFVSGELTGGNRITPEHRERLTNGQNPFAVILGCSDSRVPVELIFDQSLGDLFVIRVAGNIVVPSLIGSVEFAVAKYGTRLVVILGHTGCGAIRATIEELHEPGGEQSRNLLAIVDRIRPVIKDLFADNPHRSTGDLEKKAIRRNVENSVRELLHGSALLEELIASDDIMIVGAEYNLESGEVSFY